MASSSSLSGTWFYNVFPSFCGGDVRKKFLSHLLEKFKSRGITPFIDDEINRGQSIGPELVQAIKDSRVAIVLLSSNYSSSSWCLDELVEIMKCREEDKQTVMTIFYGVDPSDVRHQTGDFGKAFKETCKEKSEEKVEAWRQALKDVGSIAGYHSGRWENEALMINKIASDIKGVLGIASSKDLDDHVGMGASITKIMSLLSLQSDKVEMFGIVGPAGSGKTSTARALYNQLSRGFQFRTFIENIRGSNASPFDTYQSQLDCQKQLLSQIFNKNIEVLHLEMAKEKLGGKKVLVVLNEVDCLWQLEAMANKPDWFGPGSRIIITTEDRKLLKEHGINHIYEMEFPTENVHLKFFCQYAFGQKSPYDGFHRLASDVTKLVGDLPLALKVMGSYLRGISKDEWIKALPWLRHIHGREIESTLRFSYEGLSDKDKALFLHIACFFVGLEVDRVKRCLANSDLDINHGLQILEQKSLIYTEYRLDPTSSIYTEFLGMDRLLQLMGQEIVRKQFCKELSPRKPQFLMDTKEISNLLKENTGTGTVLGIKLSYSENEEIQISKSAFQGMNNLQFLYVDPRTLCIPAEGLNYLPDKLRLIHWEFCPLRFWPSKFSGKFLVELFMPGSKFEKLWEGIKPLQCLKRMDLSRSRYLKEIPDLTKATSLEVLNLSGCAGLKKLGLSYTPIEEKVSSSISSNWYCLYRLDMSNCRNLKEFPNVPDSIVELDLCKTGIEEVPPWIEKLSLLRELIMHGCEKLKKISPNISKLENLELLGLCISADKKYNHEKAYEDDHNVFKAVITWRAEFERSLTLLSDLEIHWILPICLPAKDLSVCLSSNGFNTIPNCISRLSGLIKLDVKEFRYLVTLPPLPGSLLCIDAEECEVLTRIDSPFYNPKICLNFAGCISLNQKARELIQTSDCEFALLPGEEVPTHFTHRATSGSLTINLTPRPLPSSVRFKACILLSKGDSYGYESLKRGGVSCSISGRESGLTIQYGSNQHHMPCQTEGYGKDHLFIFEDSFCLNQDCPEAEEATFSELVFEFIGHGKIWKVKGCGVRLLEVHHSFIDGNENDGDDVDDIDGDQDESDDGDEEYKSCDDGSEGAEDDNDDGLNLNQIERNIMVMMQLNDDEGAEVDNDDGLILNQIERNIMVMMQMMMEGGEDEENGDGDNDDAEGV